jgi:arylsulfatase
MDNTLIFYIAGDNGTSAEGGMVGMFNEMTYFNGVEETVADLLPLIDKWGSPDTFPHMSAGWAVAFDAPFKWTKQVASDFGGTRNGMVVHWPAGIQDKGSVRSQFAHVIDVAPTILEAAHLPEPRSVNGTPQTPIEGASLLYSFDDADAPERHTTQYFEMFGNRALYHEGWFARTIHRFPWQTGQQKPLESDVWELFDARTDFSLVRDLAAEHPEKLAELQELLLGERSVLGQRVLLHLGPELADSAFVAREFASFLDFHAQFGDLPGAILPETRQPREHNSVKDEQADDDHGYSDEQLLAIINFHGRLLRSIGSQK